MAPLQLVSLDKEDDDDPDDGSDDELITPFLTGGVWFLVLMGWLLTTTGVIWLLWSIAGVMAVISIVMRPTLWNAIWLGGALVLGPGVFAIVVLNDAFLT